MCKFVNVQIEIVNGKSRIVLVLANHWNPCNPFPINPEYPWNFINPVLTNPDNPINPVNPVLTKNG